jgi:hypothetical protein
MSFRSVSRIHYIKDKKRNETLTVLDLYFVDLFSISISWVQPEALY